MIASREQTLPFQTKIFLTVFLVALVPVFLCFAMLLPALVSTSAAGQRDAANEQLALLTGRMEHVLSSMKTALDELAEDERILPALSKQDRVQPRELYAALVEQAAAMPEVSQLMLVDESGTCLCALRGQEEDAHRDTDWGALRMAQGEQAKTFAAEIHKSANRLLTLINDIIRLSQMDAPMPSLKFEPVDLAQIAANTFEQLEMSARKADVSLQLDARHAVVEADRQMMDELLYNLCDNAIRYNVRGGSVRLEVRPVRDKVIVCVQDTGIGISPENQEHVFERFYRVDKSRSKATGGTGLGLAIVKHIAVKHNAQITLESELGRGTTISVTFDRCFKA